ncbi:MAG TPA: prolipoprotein diacylglyceryl transferase [Anaerohalosphaeraceae bacterium]|jgi:phosphatidylglycerol:prolipoprotein diacylglycerol transferase|nr:prolipoprotein diacylglyceryl transferase [Anaerohalosphaeraceae bacterium]HRT51887.1 prolipoprotein diacylglyceryl transferase [Anaerohalosphaeraceae bacterium]HRT87884.1 prolipoprotein diacylglyceryl transferase [Anaerohalosphaeraceae bacterium]
MHPELFELPIIHVTVKSYGLMMVVGFLLAVLLMRRASRRVGENPDHITNVALYALIAGVVGARIFYVVHHYNLFAGDFMSVFAVWQGGLEFLGGVLMAIGVVFVYVLANRLPLRRYFDILAIGLMLGLSFGRIGCFLNGCCFGKPTDVAWAVRFPYGSPPYLTQVKPDLRRDRSRPYFDLPAEYFGYVGEDGASWYSVDEGSKYRAYLKPKELLADAQKEQVRTLYQMLPVHPTQIYASLNALALCGILFAFWRRFGAKYPGCTLGLMFLLYGPTRFVLEAIRDDNPFEKAWWTIYPGGTVSQNLGIYLFIVGSVIFIACWRAGRKGATPNQPARTSGKAAARASN